MTTPGDLADKPVSYLRQRTRVITTHREDGKAVIHSSREGRWYEMRDVAVALNLVYTTSEFPSQMNDDNDIKAHKAVERNGLGLVNQGGTVCRISNFAPGNEAIMHRTRSLDYGVVLEGEIEMSLDSGETVLLKRGDVVVQRGTNTWKNTSATEWARTFFVLLDGHPLSIGGEQLGESLGYAAHELQPSNNVE
ncbi:cupin domain-containing protein [Aspergillus lucknowensis]|uniref:Cupin domain protein n=1 Tax=Aspergillus lucknowensis TaxID=176173 RepID=A0ABR4LHT8_9EURO